MFLTRYLFILLCAANLSGCLAHWMYPLNHRPKADAGGPYAGSVGESINFKGSGSSDADGDSLAFEWDFGDGSRSTQATPHHIYNAAGEVLVALTVNDGRGGVHKTSAQVTITSRDNRAPTANAGGPYNGSVGISLLFDGSVSTDPDNDVLTFSWDFGDGSSVTGTAPSHTYADSGLFNVRLTVADQRGGVETAETMATILGRSVQNHAPMANPGASYHAFVGELVHFDGSGSTDPDGDSLTFVWNFGDGAIGEGSAPTHRCTSAKLFDVAVDGCGPARRLDHESAGSADAE